MRQSKVVGLLVCVLLVSIGIGYPMFTAPKKAESKTPTIQDTTLYTID
jgi:hypothetical protein